MKHIVIDLESAPRSFQSLEAAGLVPTFTADKRMKDADKIAADLKEKSDEWYDKCALSAKTGELLMFGAYTVEDDKYSIAWLGGGTKGNYRDCDSEAELLKLALATLSMKDEHNCHVTLIGHNVKAFDLPFLRQRCWANKLPWSGPLLSNNRYWQDNVLDTMEVWGCGDYQSRISLDNLGKVLGVGAKSQFNDFLPFKEWPKSLDQSIEYLKNDLKLTADCAAAMGML